uniref:Secreted protein n=1 Tax=Ixodes ricinus TaxID=34613 RepID=A0A6B0VER5_IXORI
MLGRRRLCLLVLLFDLFVAAASRTLDELLALERAPAARFARRARLLGRRLRGFLSLLLGALGVILATGLLALPRSLLLFLFPTLSLLLVPAAPCLLAARRVVGGHGFLVFCGSLGGGLLPFAPVGDCLPEFPGPLGDVRDAEARVVALDLLPVLGQPQEVGAGCPLGLVLVPLLLGLAAPGRAHPGLPDRLGALALLLLLGLLFPVTPCLLLAALLAVGAVRHVAVKLLGHLAARLAGVEGLVRRLVRVALIALPALVLDAGQVRIRGVLSVRVHQVVVVVVGLLLGGIPQAAAVLDAQLLVADVVEQPAILLLLDAAEGVHQPALGLHLEVEGAGAAAAAGEVDAGDLVEAQVHGRLVDVDEAALERVQEPIARPVRAGDAVGAPVAREVARHGDLALDDRLHDSADHLEGGTRHVLLDLVLELVADVFLGHGELDARLLLLVEEQDEEVVARLALLDRGVQAEHKEHLPRVLVRQQEETQHRRERDLVVERLSVELDEGREDLDVVATARREALELLEGDHGLAGRLDDVGLGQDVVPERLDRIRVRVGVRGHVEAELHERHGGVVVLVELERHLVLGRGTVRHVSQRDFVRGALAVDVERQHAAFEARRAPIPTFEAQVAGAQRHLEVVLEELGEPVLLVVLEAAEAVHGAVLHHDSEPVAGAQPLPVDAFDVGALHLLYLAGLAVFEHDRLVGHLETARCHGAAVFFEHVRILEEIHDVF